LPWYELDPITTLEANEPPLQMSSDIVKRVTVEIEPAYQHFTKNGSVIEFAIYRAKPLANH
jgi:hypothetical protein